MSCATFSERDSVVHRLDPRGRVLAAVGFCLLVAVSSRFRVLEAGMALAVVGAFAARLPAVPTLKRLAAVNLFLVFLWLLVPTATDGTDLFRLGPIRYSREGLLLAARMTVKANAIVLAVTVLLSTMEIAALGHALHHLRVPPKLVHLLLFTERYVDVIHHEYQRLRHAMKVRCFRPGLNGHTLRTFGNLVGVLLVRSFDRAERIVAAMKCRGFCGRFYVLHHFAWRPRDGVFAAGATLVLALLGLGEWG